MRTELVLKKVYGLAQRMRPVCLRRNREVKIRHLCGGILNSVVVVVIVIIIQLVQMLGEGDEELVPEHLVLQDKLQELQCKKQHMDHLVAEFQTLHNHPTLMTGK